MFFTKSLELNKKVDVNESEIPELKIIYDFKNMSSYEDLENVKSKAKTTLDEYLAKVQSSKKEKQKPNKHAPTVNFNNIIVIKANQQTQILRGKKSKTEY